MPALTEAGSSTRFSLQNEARGARAFARQRSCTSTALPLRSFVAVGVRGPGVSTASWEVTGVLLERGVRRSRPRAAHLPYKRAAGEGNFGPGIPKIAVFTEIPGIQVPQLTSVQPDEEPCSSAFCLMRRPLLRPPAGPAASAAAVLVPAALLPCFWLTRRPDSRSKELASCHRRVIMMRSACCSAGPAR